VPQVTILKEVRVRERRRGQPMNDLVVGKSGLLTTKVLLRVVHPLEDAIPWMQRTFPTGGGILFLRLLSLFLRAVALEACDLIYYPAEALEPRLSRILRSHGSLIGT